MDQNNLRGLIGQFCDDLQEFTKEEIDEIFFTNIISIFDYDALKDLFNKKINLLCNELKEMNL